MKRRERITNALLALALIGASVWAFLMYAPVPRARDDKQQPSDARPAEQIVPARADAVVHDVQPHTLGLLGMPVSKGRADASVSDFAARLEGEYVRRGYGTLQPRGRRVSGGKSSPPSKLYWRRQANGIEMVCAVGVDADPEGDRTTPEPEMYLTIIAPNADGSSNRTTYRYTAEATRQHTSGGDFPGQDPPSVPRPEGLRRLFGTDGTSVGGPSLTIYSSEREMRELLSWYREAMASSWRHERLLTEEASRFTESVLYFSRQRQSCLIWLSPGTTSKSIVIVSMQGV